MSQLHGPAEFERGIPTSPAAPVAFAEYKQPLSTRIQRFLHAYPTVVPFFVLLLGVVLGRVGELDALHDRLEPLDDPPAGDDHRHPGDRPRR